MNNINKVKPVIRNTLIQMLDCQDISEISINDLIKEADVSRASFYRNYNNLADVISDYYAVTFMDVVSIIQDSPYATELVVEETLKTIIINKKQFSILQKRNCIYLLESFFKEKLDFSYFGNNFKTASFIRCTIALINSWIEDDYHASIKEMISMINKFAIFKHNLIHIAKKSEVVLSNKTMRDSDKATIEGGVSSKELMFRAGKAIFDSHVWKGKVAIVCGKGNNAGDGYVLAGLLQEAKIDVNLLCISKELSSDGEFYFNICQGKKVKTFYIDEAISFDDYDIIVDCIFGTGFKGEIKEPYKTIINKINASNKYVLSVDINSGLNGDNGLCETAVKSNLTLAIGSYKSGLFLNQAKDYIGALKKADIGITPIHEDYTIVGSDDVLKCIQERKNFSNKGTYGYVALIGGSKAYSGAIRLANMAASSTRMGSGVTILATPASISSYLIQRILESTIYPLDDKDGQLIFNKNQLDYLMNRCKTIAIGMGLGQSEEINKIIEYLLQNYTGKLVIDADGLNALAKLDPSLIINSHSQVILTPHVKEFERLSGHLVDEIIQNPINLANEYAKEHHCTVLLKGPTTIVTDGEKVLLVNRGCSGMATAGSGDVLSGILTSILAYNACDTLMPVAAGAYINGLAGELAENFSSDISMTSVDTINYIAQAITIIRNN